MAKDNWDTVRKSPGLEREGPAARGGLHDDVGNETKANMEGALNSQAGGGHRSRIGVGDTRLSRAVGELHEQHPHHHSAGGIHGTKDHQRHEPLHGLRPHGRE